MERDRAHPVARLCGFPVSSALSRTAVDVRHLRRALPADRVEPGPGGCIQSSNGRSTRHRVAADDRDEDDHQPRHHDAVDRVSQDEGPSDALRACRRWRLLEFRLGYRGCHPDWSSDRGVRGVRVAADVRSLMGVGRTA